MSLSDLSQKSDEVAQSQRIKCNKTLSLRDAFCHSLMVGTGESFFSAFVLFIGFSQTLTGIFASLPLAIGACLQLLTPWGLVRMGSMRKWVRMAAALQILTLLVFSVIAFLHPEQNSWLTFGLFAVASLYWAAGYAAQPVWNRWMTDLVHTDESSQFFTRRLRSTQYGTLIGLLFAGYALSHGLVVGSIIGGFALTFFVAATSRGVSSYFLSKKDDGALNHRHEGLREILPKFAKSSTERDLLLFLFLFGIAVYVSSPFVNPFLLGKLDFGPTAYTFALVALFLGKIVGFTCMHRFLGKWTSEKAMILGALGIAPLPSLWMFSTTPMTASILQAVSGFGWGIYEASLALILFRRLRNDSKVALMTLINFVQCMAILAGGLLGGAWLKFFGESTFAYTTVFALSSMMRLLVCLLFIYTWIYAKGRKVEDSTAPANFELKFR